MSTNVTLNGTTYNIPAVGESNWGTEVTNYLIAASTGFLQKAGGSFTLTAEADFGATYGLKSVYFKSRATNPSSAGIARLGNDETIGWRNAANDGDILFKVNSSDQFEFNGLVLSAATIGTADQVLTTNNAGDAQEWRTLVDANIASAAGIAYSKLAALTASRALVSDGSGFVSASSVTATELGYLASVTSSIQTQLDAKAAASALTSHTGDSDIHFEQSAISIPASQISDFDTEVGNNSAVSDNTAKVSADGSIDTHSDVDTSSVAPVNGDVLTFDGSNWVPDTGGAGSGEVNFNINPNAVSAVDNSGTNDIGDYISSGAGATVSKETTASNLPRNTTQTTGVKVTLATGTADYVSLRFEVPNADMGKKLKIEWAQKVDSYVTSTAKVELYNYSDAFSSGEAEVRLSGDNSSGDSLLPNSTGVYYNEFDADNRQYYELRIVNAGASAGTITINDFVIGPGKLHSGAIVTPWYIPTTLSVVGGLTASTQVEWVRRVGDTMEVMGQLNSATKDGAGAPIIISALPDGVTINTTVAASSPVGILQANQSTTQLATGIIAVGGASTLTFYDNVDLNNVTSVTGASWNSATNIPFVWSTDFLRYNYKVPIAEWAGSGVLNTITQDNLTKWTAFTPVLIGSGSNPTLSSSGGYWRRVGDSMELWAYASISSVGSGDYFMTLPDNKTQNSGILTASTSHLGNGFWQAAGSKEGLNILASSNGSWKNIALFREDIVDALDSADTATYVSFNASIPILEWIGSQSSLVGFSKATGDALGLTHSSEANYGQGALTITNVVGCSSLDFRKATFSRQGNTVHFTIGARCVTDGQRDFFDITIPTAYRPGTWGTGIDDGNYPIGPVIVPGGSTSTALAAQGFIGTGADATKLRLYIFSASGFGATVDIYAHGFYTID